MPADLSTTNLLLGIMAGVQVISLLGLLVTLVYVRRAVTDVQVRVADIERDHIRPLRNRAEDILGDVARISARVELQVARAERLLSHAFDVAERQVDRVRTAVDAVARETTAVVRGAGAAVAAVAGRRLQVVHPATTARRAVATSEEDRRATPI